MLLRDKYVSKLFHSVGPTYLISRILGLLPMRAKRSGGLITLTYNHNFIYFIFFLVTYLTLSSYTVYSLMTDQDNYKQIPREFLTAISIMILTLKIITVLMAYVMRNPLLKMIERFADVDIHFERFDIAMDYAMARRKNWLVMVWLVLSVICRSIFTLHNVSVDIFQQYAVFAGSFIKSQLKYLFIIFVEALYVRFNRLNEKIKAGNDLTALSVLHFRLYNCCSILVHIFGLQMMLAVGVSTANIIFQNYFLYRMCTTSNCKEHWYMIAAPVIWILDEFFEIGILVKCCNRTANAANSTPILLHELRNNALGDTKLAEEVHALSMQFLHQKLKFTALGFFPIDHTLIFSILTTVVSMLTFLIQYDMTLNQTQ